MAPPLEVWSFCPVLHKEDAELAQNPPQELEPIAEQAPTPGPADEVNLFFLVPFRFRVSFAAVFLVGFSLLSLVSVFSLVA